MAFMYQRKAVTSRGRAAATQRKKTPSGDALGTTGQHKASHGRAYSSRDRPIA
jgi:hypothetical protein